MAFLSTTTTLSLRSAQRKSTCSIRMESKGDAKGSDASKSNRKLPVTNSPPSTRKLVRNKPGTSPSEDGDTPMKSAVYADARAGDMVGAPPVGDGLGPRRGAADKKVTRAAAIQKSQTFADAWAEQNEGRLDVWLIIGAVTLLTPFVILAWAVTTGVIPTGGLFEQ